MLITKFSIPKVILINRAFYSISLNIRWRLTFSWPFTKNRTPLFFAHSSAMRLYQARFEKIATSWSFVTVKSIPAPTPRLSRRKRQVLSALNKPDVTASDLHWCCQVGGVNTGISIFLDSTRRWCLSLSEQITWIFTNGAPERAAIMLHAYWLSITG